MNKGVFVSEFENPELIFDFKYETVTLPSDKHYEENSVVDNMTHSIIENQFISKGYSVENLRYILESDRITSNDQMMFNHVVRTISEETNISLKEIVLYCNHYKNVEFIYSNVLDDITKYLLKKEIALEYEYDVEETESFDW